MSRTILASVLATHLMMLGGVAAQSVLCAHVDGTKQIEAGKRPCCAPVQGGNASGLGPSMSTDPDACPGCTDTLLSSETSARSTYVSKTCRQPAAALAVLPAPVAPPVHSILLLAIARRMARDSSPPLATPLLI